MINNKKEQKKKIDHKVNRIDKKKIFNLNYIKQKNKKIKIKNKSEHNKNIIRIQRKLLISNKYKKNKILLESNLKKSNNLKKNKCKSSKLTQTFNKPINIINKKVIIGEKISVIELSKKMAIKASKVIKLLMKLGIIVNINQLIDQKTAKIIAKKLGNKVILQKENNIEKLVIYDHNIKNKKTKIKRAPIVTIMGHVDHGKTSLLDYIRSTKIALSEVGGITQHIGAYHIKTTNGNMITFLDTPGHAAFTAMRARGAQITDIIVLVVAVDDGVMPQTIEAIQHAKTAKVPVIVAINKIDKLEYDSSKIKQELTKYGILPEEWGGENQIVYISAKYGKGINDLIDAILLQAEILDLKTFNKVMASGVVIESFIDKGKGPIATIILREGTLKTGEIILCGFEYGRVRAMYDEFGNKIKYVIPSVPFKIIGLSGVPAAGDKAIVVHNEKIAKNVALYRKIKLRETKFFKKKIPNLDKIFKNQKQIYKLNIILKSDVQGSTEAIIESIKSLSKHEVKINIICSGVGVISETDAMLAAASNAIIIGFNVRPDICASKIILKENIHFIYKSVIYEIIYELKKTLSSMFIPESKKEIIGLAEVLNIFNSKKGYIAGCMIKEGIVKCNNNIRVLRNKKIIYEGKIESIRRFKNNVNEVRNGMECGIYLKNWNNIKAGDIIEVCKNI